eukprot:TRINITY_DN257_c0_g1_i1.p1 TRINITY_DN257_c0_g1~~TRINITY_DN257_c0_g1_i1.p1  ORF type:complete len:1172 (-),score=518.49 TRINITY_DN257_c0_g1_i1:14-3529(-)
MFKKDDKKAQEKAKKEEEKALEKKKKEEEKQRKADEKKNKKSGKDDKPADPVSTLRKGSDPALSPRVTSGLGGSSNAPGSKAAAAPAAPEEPKPDAKEIDRIFDELIQKLASGEGTREMMKQTFKTPEQRWTLILQNKMLLSGEEKKNMENYLKKLKDLKITDKELEELKVTLSGDPDAFYAFFEQGGLDAIFTALEKKINASVKSKQPDSESYISECVRIIKVLMNDLEECLGHNSLVPLLCQSLEFVSGRMLGLTFQILGIIALASFYDPVIENLLAEPLLGDNEEGHQSRFHFVTLSVDKDNVDTKAAIMQLMNALLYPQDMESRVRLLEDLEMNKVVLRLRRGQTKAELLGQLEIFYGLSEDAYAAAGTAPVNTSAAVSSQQEKTFKSLSDKLKGTGLEDQFESILEHMILVPAEGKKSQILWQVLDDFIQFGPAIIGGSAPEPLDIATSLSEQVIKNLGGEFPVAGSAPVAQEPASGNNQAAAPAPAPAAPAGPTKEEKELKSKLHQTEDQLDIVRTKLQAAEKRIEDLERAPPVIINSGPAPPAPDFGGPPPPGGGPAPPGGDFGGPPPPGGDFGGPPPPGGGPPPPGGGPPPPGGDFGGPPPPGGDFGGPPPPGGGPPPPGGGPAPPGGGPPPPGGFGGPPPPGGGPPGGPPGPPGGPPGAPGAFGGGGFGGAAGRPKKANKKIEAKMKQLNWAKIPDAKTLKTVWDKASGGVDEGNVTKVINESEIITMFSAAAAVEKKPDDKAAGGAGDKKKLHTTLDPRRNQNIAIMLARFKMSHEEIRKAIETCNEDVLTTDNIVALKGYVPTPEEVQALKDEPDHENLQPADKYFLQMMQIPNLGDRLECFHIRNTFMNKLHDVELSVDNLEGGRKETRESTKLVKLLEVALAVGNVVNTGTGRGGAYGFKLDSIGKMADVRSTNKDLPTLLHYIVSIMEKDFPESFSLRNDFPHLEAASRENLGQVQADIASLKANLSVIEKQLKNAPEGGPDKFYTMMKDFFNRGTNQLTKVQAKFDAMNDKVKETLTFFGERDEAPLNEFLGTVWGAVQAYDRARGDNQKKKEAAQKLKEAEAKKTSAAAAMAAKKAAGPGAAGRGAGGGGNMDKMLGALATGEAFKRPGGVPGAAGRGAGPAGRGAGAQKDPAVANEAMAMFANLKARNQAAAAK